MRNTNIRKRGSVLVSLLIASLIYSIMFLALTRMVVVINRQMFKNNEDVKSYVKLEMSQVKINDMLRQNISNVSANGNSLEYKVNGEINVIFLNGSTLNNIRYDSKANISVLAEDLRKFNVKFNEKENIYYLYMENFKGDEEWVCLKIKKEKEVDLAS